MTKNEFIELLRNAMKDISSAICCEDGSWERKFLMIIGLAI